MGERVSALLRRSVGHLADEVPDSYQLVLDKLGTLVVALDVDGELFTLSVRGSLDDVLRAHDTLLAYVHAAVRAPSQPELLNALRTESP
jgi:hypothetical protein